MFKQYLDELSRLIFRPIQFYTRMPVSEWFEGPVTFVGLTAVILAAFLTIVIFVTQYIQIGSTLLEKVDPSKVLIIVPVMCVLAFMFFVLTITLVFGALLAAFLGLFSVIAALLYSASVFMEGKGSFIEDIKASYYMSGVLLIFALPILMIILTKKGLMDFTNFMIGYNMLYSFAILYLYGMQAIVARKVHNLPKGKAFIAAIVPTIFLILVGLVVGKAILPKFQPWIM